MIKDHKNGTINDAEYKEAYYYYLDQLGDDYIRRCMNSLLSIGTPILLCYEASGKFCHRHLLAEYLRSHYGYEVEEYKL